MPNLPPLQFLHSTRFLTSAARYTQCPPDSGAEVAFAGRSNAGKSSAINALTQQKQLARSSRTPGRTRLINFFQIGESDTLRLVDLPGYGYAAVAHDTKAQWAEELSQYLLNRRSLNGLILLMDIRHPCQSKDMHLLQWAEQRALAVHILLTKADKLNRGPALTALRNTQQQLQSTLLHPFSIQLFSSTQRTGLDECINVVRNWVQPTDSENN